ncbi:MAG TPA: DUF350 domain-containing protein [Blastocatellia bacterium]|jgi:uncharacterized membrane protein YjfL (UPF0719 family)|nr:DUF350 domain-containing protein [Blastocatellia bacterium]
MDATTICFVIVATAALLVIARGIYQLLLGQSLTETLIQQDNRAAAVALGGFMLGVVVVIIPVLSGESHSLWSDVASVAVYGLGGIAAMTLASWAFARYSRWQGLPLRREIIAGNLAAGVVAAGEFYASAQVVAGALTGDGGAITPTVVFWAAGVVALILLTHLFRYLTAYDDAALIKAGNVAAAVGYAGLLGAIGTMVGYAVSGNFTGYAEGFKDFGLMLLVVLLLYPVRQLIVQTLMIGGGFSLRNGRLDREIAEDRNVGAGLLEAVGYFATALIATRIF